MAEDLDDHRRIFDRGPSTRLRTGDDLQGAAAVRAVFHIVMLVIWRDWGLSELLREAWERGIVLTGVSAGAICWFEQGVTDSWAGELRPLDGLGFLPGSCCPHCDGEANRRPSYHRLLTGGEISAGVAIEDWTGVHFEATKLHRVVSLKRGAKAYASGSRPSPLAGNRLALILPRSGCTLAWPAHSL